MTTAARRSVALLLALGLPRCVSYEYEHEFWLRVDGSGFVYVTGRPELWAAFKAVGRGDDPEATAAAARALFEGSGLRVRRVAVTRRRGRPYVFVAADFDDVRRLPGTPAFPDLSVNLTKEGDRLRLAGAWARPPSVPQVPEGDREGLVAVRFHLPSKVYDHRNAFAGVERGNILGWREELATALDGTPLAFGATLDSRSILWSTVGLFAMAVGVALLLLGGVFYLVVRKGRRG